jgi:hypothetical protein
MTDTIIEESAAIPKTEARAERIAAQQRSGNSVKQFCKEQGLTEGSFYAWRKRLQKTEPVRFALVDRRVARQEPATSGTSGQPREVDALELSPDAGAAWSMMNPAWPKRIVCGHGGVTFRNAQKAGLSEIRIGQGFRPALVHTAWNHGDVQGV